MPRADSITAGSTPAMPVQVFRKIGSNAYRASATMAVLAPTPPIHGTGIRKPNRAEARDRLHDVRRSQHPALQA